MRGCGQRRRLQPGLRAREPVGVADGPSFPERDPDAHGQSVTEPDTDDAVAYPDDAVTDTHHTKPHAVTQPDRLPGGRHQRARRS